MQIVEIIVAVLACALVVLGGILLFGRSMMSRLLIELMQKNEEHRGQTESGVKTLLESNRDLMKQTIEQLQDQLKESRREVGDLKNQNSAIREALAQSSEVTKSLSASAESLRSLLSNNRLRGEWGEQVAEDLLLASGFVEGVNYTKQTSTAEGRPDFTFLLPDGTKLNIDAKFPYDDLAAYQQADSEAARKTHLKNFETAVKKKIHAITSKDYIDPENQTCDFVVMFIPNEMIFSFIYEKMPEVNDYANQRKVVLAGPFGFTALIRLVLQAYRNFRYEKGLQEIIGLVTKFQGEYDKFGLEMEKLGRSLGTAVSTFESVETTRHKALTRVVDKITQHSEAQLKESAQDGSMAELTETVTKGDR